MDRKRPLVSVQGKLAQRLRRRGWVRSKATGDWSKPGTPWQGLKLLSASELLAEDRFFDDNPPARH